MLSPAPAAMAIITYQLWILQAAPAEHQGGASIKEGALWALTPGWRAGMATGRKS